MAKPKRNLEQQIEDEMREYDYSSRDQEDWLSEEDVDEINKLFENAMPAGDAAQTEDLSEDARFLQSLDGEELASIIRLNSVYRDTVDDFAVNGHSLLVMPEGKDLVLTDEDKGSVIMDAPEEEEELPFDYDPRLQEPVTEEASPVTAEPVQGKAPEKDESWRRALVIDAKRFEDQMKDVDVYIDGVQVNKAAFVQFINNNKDAIIRAITKKYPDLMREVNDMIKREASIINSVEGRGMGEGKDGVKRAIFEERQRRILNPEASIVGSGPKQEAKTERRGAGKPDLDLLLGKAEKDSQESQLIAALAAFAAPKNRSTQFYLMDKDGEGVAQVGISVSKAGKEYYTVNGEKVGLKELKALDAKYEGQITGALREEASKGRQKDLGANIYGHDNKGNEIKNLSNARTDGQDR